jgi:hypothetical protein
MVGKYAGTFSTGFSTEALKILQVKIHPGAVQAFEELI